MSTPHIVNNQLPLLTEEQRAFALKEIEEAVEPLKQAILKREAVLSDLYDAKEAELGMTDWHGSPFEDALRTMNFFIKGDIMQIQGCIEDGLLSAAFLASLKFAENTTYALAKVDAFIEKARTATSLEELEENGE